MVGEIVLLIAGACLVLLLLIVGENRFEKKYPAICYLTKRKNKKRNIIGGVKRLSISPVNRYVRMARDVGWQVKPHEVIGLVIVGMAIGVGFGMVMGNEILAVGGLSLGYIFPMYVLATLAEKRKSVLSMQLESAMSIVSTAFSVYGNVMDTLKASIPLMESPIKDEFQRVVQEVESGTSLEEALMRMERRVGRKELVMFNRILVIAENAGGKVGDVLQKCARLVAENRLLKSDLEAEITQVRQDTRIMFGVTIVTVLFFRFANSELYVFYQKTNGKILLTVLFGLAMFIVYLAGKVAKPKELE